MKIHDKEVDIILTIRNVVIGEKMPQSGQYLFVTRIMKG